MKVFLSWSGARSCAIAEALREWIPNVIQAVEPWMSAEDVDKGLRWSSEIAVQLEGTRFGIICLTPDNLESPWILFEAGALSKTIDKAFVCPFLFGLDPSDVKGPLTQFQATKAEKDDTKRLITTINKALGDQGLGPQKIEAAFEQWWPDLERALTSVKAMGGDAKMVRSDRELLEEVLETVRAEARSSRTSAQMLDIAIGKRPERNVSVAVAIDPLTGAPFGPSIRSTNRTHRQDGEAIFASVYEAPDNTYSIRVFSPEVDLRTYEEHFEGVAFAQAFADKRVEALHPHDCSNEKCGPWKETG